jgi:outer membrane protein assembly factor BamB
LNQPGVHVDLAGGFSANQAPPGEGPAYCWVVPRELSRRSALAGLGGGAAAALTMAACGSATASTATGVAAVRRPGGTLLWQSRAVAADQPNIVVAADRVYVTGGGNNYGDSGTYAFDAATGGRLWRTSGSSGPYPYAASASAVYGFTVTPRGGMTYVSASDAATGRTLWTHDAGRMLDSAKVGSMGYAGGLVYIAAGTTDDDTAGQPAVRALDGRTGRRVWQAFAGSAPQEPAVAGGLVYVTDSGSGISGPGYLVALDAATGARRWRSGDLGGPVYPPVVAGNVVCCTDAGLGKGETFGLDGRTGREIWHSPVAGLASIGTEGIVFLLGFQFFSQASSFTIWALHASTGAVAWTRKYSGGPALAVAGGVLYLGYGTSTVQAIAAATGHALWTHKLRAVPAALAVGGSTVYALDANGGVYALQA